MGIVELEREHGSRDAILVFYLVNYPKNSFEHLERQELAAE